MKNIRPILIIILVGMFIRDMYKPAPDIPVENPYIKLLDLQRPSEAIIEKALPVSIAMQEGNIEDKELVGIFHSEMSKRISNYKNITTIQFENYYMNSAKDVYGDKIKGKYKDLGSAIQKLVIHALGEDEGIVTDLEMNNLSSNMKGIAWNLLGN